MTQQVPQRPVREFRMGKIQIAIWENRHQDDRQTIVRHSATLTKSFRNDKDEWHETGTFFAGDLLRLSLLAQRAAEWIDLREAEPARASNKT